MATNNSINTLNQPLTITSGTGSISIGTDGGNKIITIGNTSSTSPLFINNGSGAISIGTSIAKTITIGNTTGSSAVNINTGIGGSSITTGTGPINLQSTTGSINIGSNTGAARTIIIGTVTSGGTTIIRGGSGGLRLSCGINGVVDIESLSATTFSSAIATKPVNSSVATAAFTTSLVVATSVQNTTGYNLLVNICFDVTSATAATITLGVGNTIGPVVNTVVSSFTTATSIVKNFSAIVPNNYYLVVNTTGTITVAGITAQSCPM